MKDWKVTFDLGDRYREVVEFDAYREAVAFAEQHTDGGAEVVDFRGLVVWSLQEYPGQVGERSAMWREREGFYVLADAGDWLAVPR